MPLRAAAALLAAATLLATGAAQAERGDRSKPMVVEADKPGTFDLQRQLVVFNGNVVISQGTLSIKADRVEVREQPDGSRTAAAIGTPQQPATYRQKRDQGSDEWVEGQAQRIEYDSKGDVLRLNGGASVKRLRGREVADEITGATIVWDNAASLFSVDGGKAGSGPNGGRVRAVLAPRTVAPDSTPAAPARPASGTQP